MTPLSSRNPRVQQLRKLLRQRNARDEAGLFVIEGSGLLAEALATEATVQDVFVAEGAELSAELGSRIDGRATRTWELDPSVLASVASTSSPQPVLATVRMADVGIEEALSNDPTFVVIAAGVAEPGNAGTLIRTAAAAGADAVVFCDDSVDIFNPKVVRSSAGALFRIAVVRSAPVADVFRALSGAGFNAVGLAGEGSTDYTEIDYRDRVAIVVGNEAHGLGPEVMVALDQLVKIPMASGVESINVAAAAAIVCFEVGRQRR